MLDYASDLDAQREEMLRILSEATIAMHNDYEALEEIERESRDGILTGPQGDPGYWPGLEGDDPNWECWNNDPDYFGETQYDWTDYSESYDSYTASGDQGGDIEITFLQEEKCQPYLTEPINPSFKVYSASGALPKSVEVNGEPAEYTYLNGVVTLRGSLKEDGEYKVKITASDVMGGNETVKETTIRLDQTPPAAETSGVSEKPASYYKEAVLTVSSDDPGARLVEFTLDGKDVTPETTASDPAEIMELRVDEPGKHTLTARFADEAGNESQRIVRVFTVTDGPAAYARAHAPAFYGLAAAAVCGILLAALRRR